jgi:hypothetical protein
MKDSLTFHQACGNTMNRVGETAYSASAYMYIHVHMYIMLYYAYTVYIY